MPSSSSTDLLSLATTLHTTTTSIFAHRGYIACIVARDRENKNVLRHSYIGQYAE